MEDFKIISGHRNQLGEVPVWCERSQRLLWIDVLQSLLFRYDPVSETVSETKLIGGRTGSIGLRENGGLIYAAADGIFLIDPTSQEQRLFIGRDSLRAGTFFNDGRCDRAGRFWVGTMHESFEPQGVFYSVTGDGTLTPWFDDIIVPNGIAFSLDDKTLYFADTKRFTMSRFDYDPVAGTISNRAFFSDTKSRPGRPDGSCVDSEGFLWNAEYAGGQITRFAPDGRIDRVVMTPVSHPTSLCFGGAALDTLYITSGSYALTPEQAAREDIAGAVLAFKPGVRGVVEPRFKG